MHAVWHYTVFSYVQVRAFSLFVQCYTVGLLRSVSLARTLLSLQTSNFYCPPFLVVPSRVVCHMCQNDILKRRTTKDTHGATWYIMHPPVGGESAAGTVWLPAFIGAFLFIEWTPLRSQCLITRLELSPKVGSKLQISTNWCFRTMIAAEHMARKAIN